MKRPVELLVLAGGFGTRLRSAVPGVPKVLAPVSGRPFLDYLVENWLRQEVTGITFLLHYQADIIDAFLAASRGSEHLKRCAMRTVTEREPLGTGGAVANAVRELKLTGSFLLANADTWLGSGIERVFEVESPAMAIVRVADTGRYGRVLTQEDKVVAFAEKQRSTGAGEINAGLYHLHAGLFQDWKGEPLSLERELFPRLAGEGRLRAVDLKTDFIDIGVPEDYFRFCRWIESERTGGL